ncbi:MAG: hypothetical protein IM337_07625 [Microcystis sp. M110S1]|uniref:hypothetical protein n=1 Tax=Microcystis sp. M110S1 TaxID=2771102 RepID=UPI00258B2891|nr:hypothetical protein [Microcystis sp. M110S1]MCA2973871.1 hypothetical protein [Microcystis sp. M110S1]
MVRDETFEEFSKWWLKKYPNATDKDMLITFGVRQRWRENQRFIIKQELIRYGLIDENGKRPGVIYNE